MVMNDNVDKTTIDDKCGDNGAIKRSMSMSSIAMVCRK